jgi:hypothetical protein
MTTYEFSQLHTHELEPDPIRDEDINDDPPVNRAEPEPTDNLLNNKAKVSHHIINHDLKADEQGEEVLTPEPSFEEIDAC